MSFARGAKKPSEADFVASITERSDIGLFLVYGQDVSAITDIAAQLAGSLGPEAERVDLDSDQIRSDPALLSDEVNALSLFGTKRYVRVNMRREEGHSAFENLLANDHIGSPVIVTAGDLKKTSKLLKLVEASPNAMSYICYTPNETQACGEVMKMAASQGLRLDRAMAQSIVQYTGADRKLAAKEVEKLALYYDAAPDRPANVDIAIFDALSAETDAENVHGLVNIIMCGNIPKLGEELLAARQLGIDAIRITRALQRRVSMLAALRSKVDAGGSPDRVVESDRSIFFKERGAITDQLVRWPSQRLAGLNGHLIAIEARLMAVKAGLGSAILEQELTKIARAAARAR